MQYAPVQLAHGYAPHVGRVVYGGYQELRSTLLYLWGWHVADYRIKQGGYAVRRFLGIGTHPPLLGTAIDSGEIELILLGIERAHELKDLLLHLVWTAIGLVHLVYHHYRLKP